MNSIVSRVAALSLSLCASFATFAQTAQRQEGISKGVSLFSQGDYAGARVALAAISADNERDAKVNYYLGAAEAMTGVDPDDALRRLQTAQMRGFLKAEANLYIGRAYQIKCEYEQARAAYAKFIPVCKDDALLALAKRYDEECQSSMQIASKIFSVSVAAKRRLPIGEEPKGYGASKECGRVCLNSFFFQSDIDPNGLMYMTERGDAAYFSIADDAGDLRLMKMEKLIGGWSEMSQLRGLDGAWDDKTPVLMTDGTTLYFSSNRPGGMGGYDIYRTTYDPETRSFSEPVNMGVPFNSPFDDYLFMPDNFAGHAWFASNRETVGTDSVTVYEIAWDGNPIRSSAKSTADILAALQMPIDPEATPSSNVGTQAGRTENSIRRNLTQRDEFRFVVCDSLTYTQWEHFRSAQAARTYHQVVAAAAHKDSLVNRMATLRKEFMNLNSGLEKNTKLQELLKTERDVYALEDEVNEKTETARNEEISEITRLVSEGRYTPLSQIKVENKESQKVSLDANWLNPSNFSVYSPVFFRDARRDEDEEVLNVFTTQQRLVVLEQDSLMAWSKIVSLEADKLDSKALSQLTTDEDAAIYAARAEAYRNAAAQLASKAQDNKREVYKAKLRILFASLSDYDVSELRELYDKAEELYSSVKHDDFSADAISAKRRAIANLDKAMQRYAIHADGTFPLPAANSDVSNDVDSNASSQTETSKSEIQDQPAQENELSAKPSAEPSVAEPQTAQSAVNAASTQEADVMTGGGYRIQLGAFKNRPAALAQLPDTTKVTAFALAGRGVTRYYYGSYTSAAEAESDVDLARSLGFSGAFATKVD